MEVSPNTSTTLENFTFFFTLLSKPSTNSSHSLSSLLSTAKAFNFQPLLNPNNLFLFPTHTLSLSLSLSVFRFPLIMGRPPSNGGPAFRFTQPEVFIEISTSRDSFMFFFFFSRVFICWVFVFMLKF